ncbi:hypothetical protein ACFX15_007414 [Malus domestica]
MPDWAFLAVAQLDRIQRPFSLSFSLLLFSAFVHGLNCMQSNVRPKFGRAQHQNQQVNLNQMFKARQNEDNFLVVESKSDRQNLTSRGLLVQESQRGSGPEHKSNLIRLKASESPIHWSRAHKWSTFQHDLVFA